MLRHTYRRFIRGAPLQSCLPLVRHLSSGTVTASAGQDTDVYDVVIVGAGVVGATLGCRIASTPSLSGLRVAVIEPSRVQTLPAVATLPDADVRVFAITPASRAVFDAVGAWDAMAAVRAHAFTHMQVWDALGPAHVAFDAHGSREAAGALGYIVENRVLQSALFDRLQALAAEGRIALFNPASIASVALPVDAADGAPMPAVVAREDRATVSSNALATVTLSTEGAGSKPSDAASSAPAAAAATAAAPPKAGTRVLKARLVVGADGPASRVRGAAGVGTWGWDYGQRAVVATVRTSRPGHATAWQRFLPNGPVALLPLWGDLSSIVWSTTPAHADMLCRLTPTEFTETLDAVLHAPSDAFLAAVRGYGHSSAEEPAAAPSTLQAAPSLSGAENMAAPASTSSPPDTSSASVTSTRATEDLYNRHRDVLFLDPIAALLRLGWRATETLARSGASFSSASASAAASTAFQAPPRILETLGLRASFPLKLSQARRFVGPRCALIGDAAHSVHPLAGQGLNLGIGDADELAEVLAWGARIGCDPGSPAVLARYDGARRPHNAVMGGALDAIGRVFDARALGGVTPIWASEPLALARNMGMAALNNVTLLAPLKSAMQGFAMGTSRL